MAVRIEGLTEALAFLEAYPKKVNGIVKKSLKVAIKPVLNDIKQNAPKSAWKKMVTAKYVKGSNPTIKFGFFGEKKSGREAREIPDWFKAYWNNYGTLNKRFSGHKFQFPVKKTTKNNNAGVKSKLFFDRAIEGKEMQTYNLFSQTVVNEVNKLSNGKS